MKKFLSVLLAAVLLLTCFAAVACQNNKNVIVYLHHYDDLDRTHQQIYGAGPLPIPARNGYIFEGWFRDEDCTQPFTDGTAMSGNFHLYAKWTKSDTATHTVTFVYNDGNTSNSTTAVADGSPVLLPTPSRTGYRFDGWWTAPSGGTQWTTQAVTSDLTLYARWTDTSGTGGGTGGTGGTTSHTHNFGGSYFAYVKCSVEGCTVYGRNTGTRSYDNMYTFDKSRSETITDLYNDAKSALNSDAKTFTDKLLAFESEVEYLDGQYSWESMYSDTGDFPNSYTSAAVVYEEMLVNMCQLILDANQKFADEFWNLYPDDKDETLAMAKLYVNPASDVQDILDQWEYAEDMAEINKLYKQLVDIYNADAKKNGNANYMEYAYKVIYNREYGETEVKKMRQYIKDYIAPLYIALSYKLSDYLDSDGYVSIDNTADEDFYYNMRCESVFDDNRDAVNLIAEYFSWLDNANVGGKKIDFSNAVNDMFKNGSYFRGDGIGAYTMWVPDDDMPVCYFQQGDSEYYGYDDPFTFVHEFGHYYENIHNGGVSLSYDHDETQSQGDEMLFLAWLEAHTPSGITDGMEAVAIDSVTYMLQSIIASAAVDELEWAAYKEEVTSNFDQKYHDILAWYIGEEEVEYEDTDYWSYVVFDSAAYYVSYAISALPSVEIYAKAKQEGTEAARTAYLKLFEYCEDSARMASGSYRYTGANGVLAFCQLGDPFEEQIYKDIEALWDIFDVSVDAN